MPSYTVTNLTVGAAATKSLIELTALANARVKVRGFTIGNTAATAAQGVEFTLQRCSASGTGTAFTPEKNDPDSAAARSTAKSTMTANGTSTGQATVQVGFDIVGTYVIWFPPGAEPWIANSGIIDLRKIVGADTSVWAATLIFEE
jgi:hypothetical protein